MEQQNRRLNLVTFALASEHAPLVRALKKLRYSPRLMTQSEVSSGYSPHAQNPLVLFVGRQAVRATDFEPTLTASFALPKLLILHRGQPLLAADVIAQCTDFVSWPCREEELSYRISRICSGGRRALTLGTKSKGLDDFANLHLVGQSGVFQDVLRLIKRIARCEAATLIEGETGTGKELAARAIHYIGGRRNRPFVPVNCGAIPDELFENELFGHERGAYTDAKDPHPGVVAHAEGGTLFLDEIETLSAKGQTALLRFLDQQEYTPLGSNQVRRANVRIIAAGNTAVGELVAAHKFREDLFFRLNLISLKMPPLRERSGDITYLAEYFAEKFCLQYGHITKLFHPRALSCMNKYRWPGNVRELENFVHRHFLLSDSVVIYVQNLPEALENSSRWTHGAGAPTFSRNFNQAKAKVVSDFETKYLRWLMAETGGNVTVAAKRAGKERRALGKLLKKYGIRKGPQVSEL